MFRALLLLESAGAFSDMRSAAPHFQGFNLAAARASFPFIHDFSTIDCMLTLGPVAGQGDALG
jgi:hypothetical protein